MKLRGFTLLEMVAVVTILIILAGISIPIANGLIEDSKVARTLDCARKIADACRRYYSDTGNRPQNLGALWKDSGSTPGWNGPYLDRPVDNADNAFEGTISLSANAVNFSLMHADPSKVTPGLALDYSNVPMTAVIKIEEALDDANNPVVGTVNYALNMTTGKAVITFYLMPWNL